MGVGKQTVAHEIAAQLVGRSLESYPYLLVLESETSIGIESIRQVQEHLKLQTPGSQAIRRVVIVNDAQRLTIEAQNAMLKILEEPPADTCIILSADRDRSLLTTIRSRCTLLRVTPPGIANAEQFFVEQYGNDPAFKRNIAISDGLPGLFVALMEGSGSHTETIDTAKAFLSANQYDRLCMVESLAKSDTSVDELLWAIDKIARAGHSAAIDKDTRDSQKWRTRREQIAHLSQIAQAKPSKKLLLTDLALSL